MATSYVYAGVTLNGRDYYQGSHVMYSPYVRRRGNEANVPGGTLGSSQSHLVGTVRMFYVFTDPHGKNEVFASIRDRKILEKDNSMAIIDTLNADIRVRAFEYEYDSNLDTVVHIDAITAMLMCVPHYNAERSNTHMCCIHMWHAR
jgi:hypothetical protein